MTRPEKSEIGLRRSRSARPVIRLFLAGLIALFLFAPGLAAQDESGEASESVVSQPAPGVSVEPAAPSLTGSSAEEENSFEETEAPAVELFEGESVEPDAESGGDANTSGPSPASPGESGEEAQPAYWKTIMQGLEKGGDAPAGTTGDDAAVDRNGAGEPESGLTGTSSYIKGISALLVVLALILGCYALVKRYGKSSPLFAGARFGKILGRIYLDSRSSLHFVRVGSKVLVVGVTRNGISRVAELEADIFEELDEEAEPALPREESGGGFAAHLRERTVSMLARESAEEDEFDDSEIVSLRDDIQRLQRTLRDPSGEADDE